MPLALLPLGAFCNFLSTCCHEPNKRSLVTLAAWVGGGGGGLGPSKTQGATETDRKHAHNDFKSRYGEESPGGSLWMFNSEILAK